jgi:hypothetical protein
LDAEEKTGCGPRGETSDDPRPVSSLALVQ